MNVKAIVFHNKETFKIHKAVVKDNTLIVYHGGFMQKDNFVFGIRSKPKFMASGMSNKSEQVYFCEANTPYTLDVETLKDKLKFTFTPASLNKIVNTGLLNNLLGNPMVSDYLIFVLAGAGVGAIIGWVAKAILSGM